MPIESSFTKELPPARQSVSRAGGTFLMWAFARFIERISLRFLRRGAEALGHAASSAAQAGKHFAVEQLPRLCYIESEYMLVEQLLL